MYVESYTELGSRQNDVSPCWWEWSNLKFSKFKSIGQSKSLHNLILLYILLSKKVVKSKKVAISKYVIDTFIFGKKWEKLPLLSTELTKIAEIFVCHFHLYVEFVDLKKSAENLFFQNAPIFVGR